MAFASETLRSANKWIADWTMRQINPKIIWHLEVRALNAMRRRFQRALNQWGSNLIASLIFFPSSNRWIDTCSSILDRTMQIERANNRACHFITCKIGTNTLIRCQFCVFLHRFSETISVPAHHDSSLLLFIFSLFGLCCDILCNRFAKSCCAFLSFVPAAHYQIDSIIFGVQWARTSYPKWVWNVSASAHTRMMNTLLYYYWIDYCNARADETRKNSWRIEYGNRTPANRSV